MKLESFATPQLETPQQRYASLHRAIECGLASDEIWKELADVCLRLGHGEEAVRCMRRIKDQTMRIALASRLARLHLIEAPPEAFRHHPALAKASGGEAPVEPEKPSDELWGYRLADHVIDAFQHLLHQHMPWLVLITTLAFPGVIGVGGFLTAGGSWVLLAAMAALPGLFVLATVGAMGRRVLLASAEGHEVNGLPDFHQLVVDARRFLADAGVVLGSLLGPSLLALWLGVPFMNLVPGLVIGAFLAPMAWVLRQLRGDFKALSPAVLVGAIARTIRSYLGVAAITVGLFVPAAVVTYAVFGRPLWVQIAIIGPLCVLPVFVTSRLLGTWVDAHRHQLGNLLHCCTPKVGTKATNAPIRAVSQAPVAAAPKTRPAARPAAVAAAAPRRTTAARPAAPAAGQPAAAARRTGPGAPPPGARGNAAGKSAPPPSPIRAKPKAPAPAPAPAAPKPRPAAKPAPRAIEGRGPSRRPSEAPVLEHMPGAVVVTGADRRRHGAAARRP